MGWGNPAIVLRCGVARPASLKPGDFEFLPAIDGVLFSRRKTGATTVYTSVDRAAYIDIAVPKKYPDSVIAPLAAAIAKALPAVCKPANLPNQTPPPDSELCTYRK